MIKIKGMDVSVSKKDSASYTVTFDGDIPPDGTEALVSIKRNPNVNEAMLEKKYTISDGMIDVNFTSEETDFVPSVYYWDIRLIYEDGKVFTPFNPAKFEILEVVGNV